MTYITIATEDELSEAVGSRLLSDVLPEFTIIQKLRRQGNGYLKSRSRNFNSMALRHPVFLITDLDNYPCAGQLINNWFRDLPVNPNLKFRVAVREIESWLLADHQGMTNLLDRAANNIVPDPDQLQNPKQYLLERARRASRDVRNDLTRMSGPTVKQGLGYNSRLCKFVEEVWDPNQASQRSNSLARAIGRLNELRH